VKKEQESTVTPMRTRAVEEESNVIPMKKEVQVEKADQQPATIIFITSGFGKIQVQNNSKTSPMAIAA
jgi:hypothetical protein